MHALIAARGYLGEIGIYRFNAGIAAGSPQACLLPFEKAFPAQGSPPGCDGCHRTHGLRFRVQGYVRVARHGLSETDLCQEPQPAAGSRGTGPVLLGHVLGWREKLTGPDGALDDLPEVVLTDLGIERRLIIVIVRQFRHRHLLALGPGTTTAYFSILTLTRVGYRVSGHDAAVIDPESATPVYVQLANLLRQGIQDGTYPPDRALPSIRTLQQTYEVADGTVQKALRILKDEGLAHTVQGRGVFVTSRRPQDG